MSDLRYVAGISSSNPGCQEILDLVAPFLRFLQGVATPTSVFKGLIFMIGRASYHTLMCVIPQQNSLLSSSALRLLVSW